MKKAALSFCAVLVLALVLRLIGIAFQSLWLDEGYQSMVDAYGHAFPNFFAVPPAPFIFHFTNPGTAVDVLRNFRSVDPLCPPLYPLILNTWIHWFGGSDIALRSLSVVVSLSSLTALYWFCYLLFGRRVAVFAGLIQALSPYDIHYSHEVRMYALVVFTSTLSSGSLAYLLFGPRAVKDRRVVVDGGPPDGKTGVVPAPAPLRVATLVCWLTYIVSVWALINSHYTGLFIFATQIAVSILVAVLRRSFALIASLALSWLGVFAIWLPWFGLFKQAAAIRTASFYVARKPTWYWPLTALFLRIPSNWVVFLCGKQVVWPAVPIFAAAGLMLALSVMACLCPQTRAIINGGTASATAESGSAENPLRRLLGSFLKLFFANSDGNESSEPSAALTRRNATLFICAWALLPQVGLWLIDVIESHRVIEISRYVIGTAPAIFILCGVGLASMNWRRRAPRVLLSAYVLFAFIQTIACSTYFHEREPWRNMAHALEAQVSPGQLVLVSQYYDIACLDRYLSVPYKQVGIGPAMGSGHLNSILNGVHNFALVTAQEGEALVQLVPPSYHLKKKIDLEHGLHLRTYSN